jgi:L-aspartate oxidase
VEATTLELEVARTAAKVDRRKLQQLMWSAAGIERTGEGLSAAQAQLSAWRGAEEGDVAELETANLLELARVVVASALARRESRGAHFREDFPETQEALAASMVVQLPVGAARARVGVAC